MEIKVNNPHNLNAQSIDKYVCRVKILPINSSGQILLCNVNGAYSFIGGHVENGENLNACYKRELLEETGIETDENAGDMFLLRQNYEKNYFNSGLDCLSEIYYILVLTDEKIHNEKMRLTEGEQAGGFRLEYVDINQFENKLKKDKAYKEKTGLYNEMIEAVNFCKKNYFNKKQKEIGDE